MPSKPCTDQQTDPVDNGPADAVHVEGIAPGVVIQVPETGTILTMAEVYVPVATFLLAHAWHFLFEVIPRTAIPGLSDN